MTHFVRRYAASYRLILKLGLPIVAGQVGMIVTGFADNIMVGRYSTDALASASFVNNVFNVAILCCIGFTYGLTPLIGALAARGDNDAIGRTARNGLRVNVAFTLIVTALMGVLYFFIPLLGQPEHLLPTIRPYYLLYLAGMVPVAIFNVFAQWSYAIRNTSLPMWIILGTNALNILGNWLLIYGHWGLPEMGLTGAGVSTLVTRMIGPVVIASVFLLGRRYRCYRDGWRSARLDSGAVRELRRTGLPVAMQMSFETGSFSIAAIMAGWLGAVELAAFQIMVITGTLGFCIYYGFGSAVAVVVSNEAGLDSTEGMRRTAWAGYHVMLVTMTLSSLAFLLGGRSIIGSFSDDAAVLAVACSLIFPLILYQSADASQITFANALRGTSNVMPMLWIAFVSYMVVGVPVTWLFAFPMGMGLYGIMLSFSVSLALAAVLYLVYFLRTLRYLAEHPSSAQVVQ